MPVHHLRLIIVLIAVSSRKTAIRTAWCGMLNCYCPKVTLTSQLIFSVAMIASFVQVFIESFERAIGRQGEPAVELSWIGMGTMLATIGIKAVL